MHPDVCSKSDQLLIMISCSNSKYQGGEGGKAFITSLQNVGWLKPIRK